ncbi:MAG TPA: response regulator transcription factor [Ktedonobacterales bacterium]|jgi:two-component system OmpR family response regulator
MRILLVEDDVRLARSYQRNLERAAHRVDVCHDAETAHEKLRDEGRDIHVVILDVMLPGRSGIELCRDLRHEGIATPILLLTALGQTEDKVAGLDAGADDYLTKPFPIDELLARLRALVRRPRTFEADAAATQLRVGDLVVDQLQHEVYRGNRLVPMTPNEYALLEYLTRHADRVLTRAQLMDHLWPDGTEAGSNVLETYIHHLRDKLEANVNDRLIHTIRGVGYALRTPKAGDRT